MGGEIIMIFEAGETAKVKALDWDKLTLAPKVKGIADHDFWVTWVGNKLELGYTCCLRDWAQAIAHELCKRFRVKKGGWDSVGYCKDVNEFKRARAFGATMSSMRINYLSRAFYALSGEFRVFKRAQKVYEKEAKRLLDEQSA